MERLPIELREHIYEYLVADDRPKVVPQGEPSRHSPTIPGQADANWNPFRDNPVFNTRIMGHSIGYETRAYFVRTTPIYFRGPQRAYGLEEFLKIEVQPCIYLCDLIRHLRVYLSCETFDRDMQNILLNIHSAWLTEVEKRNSAATHMYERYGRYLEDLRCLFLKEHNVKLEICILHGLPEDPHSQDFWRKYAPQKYNILESIKPLYFSAKDAGVDISVRCEYLKTGYGEDVSWQLDLDAEAWRKRVNSITYSL
jgi:hypothetical protein